MKFTNLSMTKAAIRSRRYHAAHSRKLPVDQRKRQACLICRTSITHLPGNFRTCSEDCQRLLHAQSNAKWRAQNQHRYVYYQKHANRNPAKHAKDNLAYRNANLPAYRARERMYSAANPGVKNHNSKRFAVRANKALRAIEVLAISNPVIYRKLKGSLQIRGATALRALKVMGIKIEA